MANPDNLDNHLNTLRMDEASSGLKLSTDEIQLLDVKASKNAEFDFVGQLDHMAKEAKQRHEVRGNSFAVSDFKPITGLASERPEDHDPVERLVREAERLIRIQRFDEALPLLDQALEQRPHHAEALYLKAYCYAHHVPPEPDLDEKALEALLPLRQAHLDPAFEARVDKLRGCIRPRRLALIMLKNFLLITTQQFDDSIAMLRREIRLDPDVGLCHFMLAGGLMMADKLDNAHQAATTGLEIADDGHRAPLLDLRSEIERRIAVRALQPALRHYKAGRYPQARAALQGVPAVARQARLFVIFEDYLARLGGRAGFLGLFRSVDKAPADVQPMGNAKDVDTLGFFIVGEELAQGRRLLKKDDGSHTREAEALLAHAVSLTPFFPFVHFLYGAALFRRAQHDLGGDKPPPIEAVMADMERARHHAREAARDLEIGGVREALGVIEKTIKMLANVKKELARHNEEARQVNAAIEQYCKIMESAKGGLRDSKHQRELLDHFAKLRQQLQSLTRLAKSEKGREAVRQLTEAVETRLGELKNAGESIKEAEIVKGHAQAFSAMIAELKKHPISDFSALLKARQAFEELRTRIQSDLCKIESAQAHEFLDQLLGQVDMVLLRLRQP